MTAIQDRPDLAEDTAPDDTRTRLVVVGNGMSGARSVEETRTRILDATVALHSERLGTDIALDDVAREEAAHA